MKETKALRNEFLLMKSSAIKFQSFRRMILARRNFGKDVASVIICQSAVRGLLNRRKFVEMKSAALVLQKHFRGYQQTLSERNNFLIAKTSARKIQAWWRKVYERKQYLKLKFASIVLQKHLRGRIARMKVEAMRRSILREKSAVKIQSIARGWMTRRKINEQKQAVSLIQNWYLNIQRGLEQRRKFLEQKKSALMIQSWFRKNAARKRFLELRSAVIFVQSCWRMKIQRKSYLEHVSAVRNIQSWWKAQMLGERQRQDYLLQKKSVIAIQSKWKSFKLEKEYQSKRKAALILQKHVRGWIARRFVQRKRNALHCLQRAAMMMKERKSFLRTRTTIIGVQAHCRGNIARKHFLQLKHDQEYREQLRIEAEKLEAERRDVASIKISQHMRMVVERKKYLKVKKSAIVIQKFWRGHWHRKVVMERLSEMEATYKMIKQRLEEATASAKPEDCLAARTASAIDYIFSIRDVAQLIRAVKTLDLSTRLSLDCCWRMTEMFPGGSPTSQLVSLMARCNRSEPHKEVVSTTLDILINVSRVPVTREILSSIPSLLSDLFQTMLVYRDSSPEIFSKCCAVLQILSASQTMRSQLTTTQSKKRLADYQTIVTKKKRLKEENQRRKSVSVLPQPQS